MSEPWLMRVEGGLAAHFKVPDGPSRPGVQWTIGLKQGERTYRVMVKGLLADDASAETQQDHEYQAQVAMQYLNDQLNAGWHPDEERDHLIFIGNSTGEE
jgi:hypothetical protein